MVLRFRVAAERFGGDRRAQRKNQAQLTAAEKQALVNAVLALKQQPSQLQPQTASRYDDYVQIHMDVMMPGATWAHRGPAFLPWHREYLRRFELDLQAVANNLNIGILYWDWTVDRSPTSSIWSANFMGGDGRPADAQLITGPFAFNTGNWNITVTMQPGGGPDLRRRLNKLGLPLPSATQVAAALNVVPYGRAPWSVSSMVVGWGEHLKIAVGVFPYLVSR